MATKKRRKPAGSRWDRWALMGLVACGAVAMVIYSAIEHYDKAAARRIESIWALPISAVLVTDTFLARVCLTLSPLAPDSDMSELDSEFKSLQRRGRVFSVRRSEWDDAGDRLRSYFNIINCNQGD